MDQIDVINARLELHNVGARCHYCYRIVPVMEGTYDFDEMGIAAVVTAPRWSREALATVQSRLREAAEEQDDPSISDDEADRRWDRLVDDLHQMSATLTTISQQNADLQADVKSLKSDVAEARNALANAAQTAKAKPRRTRAALLWSAITVLATIGGVPQGVELVSESVQWAAQQVGQAVHPAQRGSLPQRSPVAPSTAAPRVAPTTSSPAMPAGSATNPSPLEQARQGQRQQPRRLPRSKRQPPQSP